MPLLSSPLTLPCGLTLPNRIVKAATEEALSDAHNAPTPALSRLYARWSQGGAGLLLTGHVIVDRAHRGRPRDVVVEDDSALESFRAWATAAKSGGARAWMQINHGGRQTPRMINPRPAAPSAVDAVAMMGSFGRPRALFAHEIHDVVDGFVRAAHVAQRAGFDGVQIHAAHGYLLSQFLSPRTNRRTDAWGGSIENRARLLLDVVRAVRARVGPRFAVSVKVNSADFQRGGFDGDDFRAVAQMLDAEGVDLLEISGGSYESFAFFEGTPSARTQEREAYFLSFAREIRALVRMPIMVTGGFRSAPAMESALAEGVDLVGLARPLIVEPELPRALLANGAARATALPKRRAPKRISALAEGAWYWVQLARIARGQEPDVRLSTWRAMGAYVGFDLVTALFAPKPARPQLPAPRPAIE